MKPACGRGPVKRTSASLGQDNSWRWNFRPLTRRISRSLRQSSADFWRQSRCKNSNAALNAPQDPWPQLGIHLLAPGESQQLQARFTVVSRLAQA